MKSVINQTLKKGQLTDMSSTQLTKTLDNISQQNKQYTEMIENLESQSKKLCEGNQNLDKEIQDKKIYIDMLKKQIIAQQCECEGECHCPEIGNHGEDAVQEQQKSQGEEEQQMGNWMENVQAYSGFPQESIDLLIEMEYQGNLNDPEICLSCYQPMENGNRSKYLPCSHIFHSECINGHLKVNKLCPACGEEVFIV